MSVAGLVGVYHARGGWRGETAYVIGKLLGTAHCSLCDVTHSPVRRKPAWDAMVERLGLPVELLHLDEQPADVAAVTATSGTPAVLARHTDGSVTVVLGPDDLEPLDGSVEAFERALGEVLAS
ncbi:MAG: hypothetical protein JWN84_2450 [Nocardioides sp.]|jgi:hypothetical protein|nr:hypothetical protein [Nocardioides sp.]